MTSIGRTRIIERSITAFCHFQTRLQLHTEKRIGIRKLSGDEKLYQGKERGKNKESYESMTDMLKELVSGFDLVVSSESTIAKSTMQDASHCINTIESIHQIVERVQD